MYILIDKTNLLMVAAAKTLSHACVIGEVEFPNVATCVFNGLDGRAWSMLTEAEAKKFYENMSGEKAPDYGKCIAELRDYVGTWSVYPRGEAELTKEAHKLEVQNEDDYDAKVIQLHARQAAIENAANQRSDKPAEGASEPITEAPKAKREPSAAPSKPGATKRVWEICDAAVAEGLTDLKAIRARAKDNAVREGINEGTFGVQFGKWKTANAK